MDELRNQLAALHAPVELATARADAAKALCLLRALKSGAIRIEQVVIDGTNVQVLDPTQVPVVIEEGAGT